MSTEDFLSPLEEEEVVNAIIEAEKNTSGEIRVHIENKANTLPFERAKEVFFELGMHQTQARNGVLFYICLQPKSFVILGDEGIDKKVQSVNFWEGTKQLVLNHFKQGKIKEGLVYGILKAGVQLQLYFPSGNTNKNELSNEISRG